MSWLSRLSAVVRKLYHRAKYGPPSSTNHTAAFREFFRDHKSASDGPVLDDELRDVLFFWFHLECASCGRIDEFDDVRSLVDDDYPNWSWEFAKLAVIPARRAGWTAMLGAAGIAEACCPECSKRRQSSEILPPSD